MFIFHILSLKDLWTNSFKFFSIVGATQTEANLFLSKNKLLNRDPDLMISTFQIFKNIGFTNKEILHNGKLFIRYPVKHEMSRWVMEEGGFCNFNPEVFLK